MTDAEREELIELYRRVGTLETDRTRKRVAFERMRELIGARSPEQVRRMEEARGLAR